MLSFLQRTTRKIALTIEGAAFLEDCQRILTELEEAETSVSRTSAKASSQLTISAPAALVVNTLPPDSRLLGRAQSQTHIELERPRRRSDW